MDENVIRSKKVNFNKAFKVAWIVIGILLIIVIAFYLSKYSTYKKIQDKAVEITLLMPDLPSYAAEESRDEQLETMFDYYKDNDFYDRSLNGVLQEGFKQDGENMSSFMNSVWGAIGGRGWFYYHNFFSYFLGHLNWLFNKWAYLVCLLLALNLLYFVDRKNEVVIAESKIFCNHGKKTIKEFLVRDIKSIEFVPIKGLKIQGNSIKYRIGFIKNRDEIKSTIMDKISTISEEKVVVSTQGDSADLIAKYKKLLDSGVITQEEFDAKKKQILEA